MLREQCRDFCFVMEWGVIHDNEAWFRQGFHQHLFHPCQYGVLGASTRKEHGSQPRFVSLSHDKIGAVLFLVSGYVTVDFYTARCPTVWTMSVFLEPAFVKVHHVFTAVLMNPFAQTS